MRFALCLLAATFALSSQALAWTSSISPPSSWVSTYDVELNASGSNTLSFGNVERIFDASLNAWVSPACSDFSYGFDGTTSTLSSSNGDNRNVHGFLSSWPAGYGDRTSVLGLTSSRYVGTGGGGWRNAEADISYNEDYFTFVDRAPSGGREADLQSVATHENGHALGLGHSTNSGATMYPTVLSGTNSRSLNDDDRDGVCTLYPSGDTGTTTTTTTPPDGCVYDFSAYGAESCDTAWFELGVDCATLESSYGWDCAGCECPGDGYGPDDDGCVYDFSDYGSESCDTAWEDFGLDCETLEDSYGWDCRGCECPGDGAGTGTGGTSTSGPTDGTTPTDETTSGTETTPDDETDDGTIGEEIVEDLIEEGEAILEEVEDLDCGCVSSSANATPLVWLVALLSVRRRRG
jgi:hypothetical protein